jgi:antitoxin component of RelBE/YafQ-DinJ toxin-antitoxin module
MDLALHVESLRRHLTVAAEAGGEEARAIAERLAVPMEAAIRLTLQEAVAAAAEEISCEFAPGSVEVRLRGRDLEFVVTPPTVDAGDQGEEPAPPVLDADDGSVARINLRLSDQLKGRVEQAAAQEGLSVNSWLVRAAAAKLERSAPDGRRPIRTPQRFTGWAR